LLVSQGKGHFLGWRNFCIYKTTVEEVFYWIVFELFLLEDNMRASREPRQSMAEGEGSKDEVRCSECGTKLLTLKDQIQKEDSFVCASCYHNMVYGHHTVGMEVFE
jgi:DNA-directed RNA polymerase subunit RPC12/RpoP